MRNNNFFVTRMGILSDNVISNLKTNLSRLSAGVLCRKILVFTFSILLGFSGLSTTAFALPQGGQVTNGVATIVVAPNSVIVNQSSPKAIINWQSFNINANQSTHFQQPTGGVALNRINPAQGVSQIYGHLTATGQIILINNAGIFFGPSAYVNVGGIIASTANLADKDFLNYYYKFTQVSPYVGSIINKGHIVAANNGLIALIGTSVTNNGLIEVNYGKIVLASGSAFTMSFAGNDMVGFTVDEVSLNAGVDQDGKPLHSGVENTGKLIANGGTILVTAKAASNVLDNVINMKGIAIAKSVGMQNGVIVLLGTGGKVEVSGTLIASGKKHGESGGTINVFGTEIALVNNAVLDVSGDKGGGKVLVGGDAHGATANLNADYTRVGPNVNINADALQTGNGGDVVIWSNLGTQFYGQITAQGGALSGNGGWVETSGRYYLDVNGGTVNALARHGATGTWLLDPTNIYIALNQANATAAGMTTTDTSANVSMGVNPQTFASTGAILDSLLTTGNLTTALGTANVIVTTTNANGTGLGNINIVDPIAWASANSLTLTAANNININGAITTGAAGSALILNATGAVTQSAAISGAGGLTQQGSGTTTLSLANTYSGATAVNAGLLMLSGNGTAINSSGFTVNQGSRLTLDNSGTNVTDRIAGTLTMNGGEFVVIGNALANTTETIGALSFNTGYSTITLTPNAGRNTQITFASLTRASGAGALFRGINLGANTVASQTANSSNIVFTAVPTLTGAGGNSGTTTVSVIAGAIGAGGGTGNTSAGTDFVTYNPPTGAVSGLRPLLAGEYAANPGNNVNLRLVASRAANDTFSINSLLLSGGITYNYDSNGGANTLTIGGAALSGNVLSINGNNTIQTTRAPAGNLVFGTAEAKIFAVSNLTFGTNVPLTGSGGLTVNGPSILLQNRSVAITGGLTINSGALRLGIANAFSVGQPLVVRAPGTFNLNGFDNSITTLSLDSGATSGANITTGVGTLSLGGDVTLNVNGSGATGANIAGNLALGASRNFIVNDGAAASDVTINALISGANFGVTKSGGGTLTLGNIANTYTGQTIISAGTLSVPVLAEAGFVSSIGTGASNSTIDIGSTGVLQYTGSGSATARLINLTGSGGTIDASGTGLLTLSGGVTGNTFGLVLTGTGMATQSGIINITSGGITKNGSGTWTLSGANTYSGATTVNAGKLSLGVVGALGTSASTTVATGGALDIAFNNATLTNANTINLNSTGIAGAGALMITGNSVTLTNPISLQSSTTIGGTGTGNVVLGGAITGTNTNLTINLSNAGLLLPAITLATSGNVSLTTSGTVTQTGILTIPGTLSLIANLINSDIIFNTQANNIAGAITFSGTLGNFRDILIRNVSSLATLPAFTGLANLRNVIVLFDNAPLVLNSAITTTGSGNSILLAGTSFTNNAGPSALNPGAGNFLVWSGNPANDNRGGIAYNFKQYNATYGVSSVAGTGSGFLYTVAPIITPSLTGSVSKSYTGTVNAILAAGNYTFSGAIDADTVVLNNPTSGTYASSNAGTNINVAVSGIAIDSAKNSSATVYGYQISPTTVNANIGTITQAPLTISANNLSKIYGQTITFNGTEFVSSGLQNSETIGVVTLTSTGAVNTANVAGSPYNILVSNASGGTFNAANYSISYSNGALTVNPANLNVTANNTSKTYGQTFAFNGTEFVPIGLQNSETIGSVTLASTGALNTANVAGSPYNILASNAIGGTFNAANYTISYSNGALTVNPAGLNVTANNASKTYGQTFTFNGTEFISTGLQNSETIGSVSLTSTGAVNTANVAGGPYNILASNAIGGTFNAANYSISYSNGALTVNPANLNVTANNASKIYGQTVTFNGTEFVPTGLQNSETVGSVTLTSAGAINTANVAGSPYTIVPSNAAGGSFTPTNYSITYSNGVLGVNPATLTYAADVASRIYGAANPVLSGVISGFVNGETQTTATTGTLNFLTNAVATSDVGNYSIFGSGLTANFGNYTFTQAPSNVTALSVVQAPLSVTANDMNKNYGEMTTFFGNEFTSVGLQNSETIDTVTLASLGESSFANVVGSPYVIDISAATGGTFKSSNYNISYINGTLTVNPAPLDVIANDANKTYGETITFTGNEFSSSGLQNNETIGSVTLLSAGAVDIANVDLNPYAIVVSNATAGTFDMANYAINYINGNLTITPATLTYTADQVARAFNETNPVFLGTVTGYVLGQTQGTATTGALAFTSDTNVNTSPGSYSILGSGLVANHGNYSFIQASGNATALTINPAVTPPPLPPVPPVIDAIPNIGNVVTPFLNPKVDNSIPSLPGDMNLTMIPAATVGPITSNIYGMASGEASIGGTFSVGATGAGTLVGAPAAAVLVVMPGTVAEGSQFFTNIWSNLYAYSTALLAALITSAIMFFAKRRRDITSLSFRMRTALNTIAGYANIFNNGQLGLVTAQQKEYLDGILTGAQLVSQEIDRVESSYLALPDKQLVFNMRSALMDINGYAGLIGDLDAQPNGQQMDSLNQMSVGSNDLLDMVSN
jgi:filamentous hemagglutinin family protein